MRAQAGQAAAIRDEYGQLLTGAEVGARFKVAKQTATRWATQGLLTTIRTPGGHRRYSERQVTALVSARESPAAVPPGRAARQVPAPSPAARTMRDLPARIAELGGEQARDALAQVARHASGDVQGALELALDAVAPRVPAAGAA